MTATKDLEKKNLLKLLDQMKNDDNKGSRAPGKRYYYIVAEAIADYYKENVTDIDSMNKVVETVANNCDTGFYSHSFSSALLTKVEHTGLDISEEEHQDSYKVLEPLFNAEFNTGTLHVNPLSAITFLYAEDGVPNRLMNGVLGYLNIEKNPDETLEEYLKRKLIFRLNQDKAFIKEEGDEARAVKIHPSSRPKDLVTAQQVFSTEKYQQLWREGIKLCEFYGR